MLSFRFCEEVHVILWKITLRVAQGLWWSFGDMVAWSVEWDSTQPAELPRWLGW